MADEKRNLLSFEDCMYLDAIKSVMVAEFGVQRIDLVNTKRRGAASIARHWAMYFLRRHVGESYPSIARIMRADARSCQYAVRKVRTMIRNAPDEEERYKYLRDLIDLKFKEITK